MEPISGVTPGVPLPAVAGVAGGVPAAMQLQSQEAVPFKKIPLESVVGELNRTMEVINTSISFSIDQGTGKTVIRVMEAGSGKLIRQIPAEEMLRISARLNELLGLIYDQKR